MRTEVQRAIDRFLANDLPRDQAFYQQRREAIERLTRVFTMQTSMRVGWAPPHDLFNFYHLQYVFDAKKAIVLHLLLSTVDDLAYGYWQRGAELFEAHAAGHAQRDHDLNPREQLVWQLVYQALQKAGWQWLTPAEANTVVPNAAPPWPAATGPTRVRDLIFPGCSALLD